MKKILLILLIVLVASAAVAQDHIVIWVPEELVGGDITGTYTYAAVAEWLSTKQPQLHAEILVVNSTQSLTVVQEVMERVNSAISEGITDTEVLKGVAIAALVALGVPAPLAPAIVELGGAVLGI